MTSTSEHQQRTTTTTKGGFSQCAADATRKEADLAGSFCLAIS
jgi:hypothetical protein